jgi:dynein heavy chain
MLQPDLSALSELQTDLADFASVIQALPEAPALTEAEADASRAHLSTPLKRDLIASLTKFSSHISSASEQIKGDVRLHMPTIDVSNPEAMVDDFAAIATVAAVVEAWTPLIAKAIEHQRSLTPAGRGPLAELEFWRARRTALGTLAEQIRLPHVNNMRRLLELSHSQALPAFAYQVQDLTAHALEADDNVKFLATLERHFKHLAASPIPTVVDSLPSLMTGVSMVWSISRHYSDDEHMVPLLARIAWQLGQRCRDELVLRDIVTSPEPEAAAATVRQVKRMLDRWHESYLTQRRLIEQGGREQRWEFDRQLLFGSTNYMSARCADLLRILSVLRQFHDFLGPSLGAITGDVPGMAAVRQAVRDAVQPFVEVEFDIFDPANLPDWADLTHRFDSALARADKVAHDFIDASFSKLRSVEGALDLLLGIQDTLGAAAESSNGPAGPAGPAGSGASSGSAALIPSGAGAGASGTSATASPEEGGSMLARHIATKLDDVLSQFADEVRAVHEDFLRQKDNPPVARDEPPIAGAVVWARSLFQHVQPAYKKSRQVHRRLLSASVGRSVEDAYATVVTAMQNYERTLFQTWRATADSLAMAALKQPLLRHASCVPPASTLEKFSPEVNLSPQLLELVEEARLFDRLGGFALSQTVINVSLQSDRYRAHSVQLQGVVRAVAALEEPLQIQERKLAASHLQSVRDALLPGLGPLNWHALGVPAFIQAANDAVSRATHAVAQVRKASDSLGSLVSSISRARLISPPVSASRAAVKPAKSKAKTPQEYMQELKEQLAAERAAGENPILTGPGGIPTFESFRASTLKAVDAAATSMLSRYRQLRPLLQKVEELTAGSSTGSAESLAEYYAYWDQKTFAAVAHAIVSALSRINANLSVKPPAIGEPVTPENTPLFSVTATLAAPEIALAPSLPELQKGLAQVVTGVVDVARRFPRWMPGTCLESPGANPTSDAGNAVGATSAAGSASNGFARTGAVSVPSLRGSGDFEDTPDYPTYYDELHLRFPSVGKLTFACNQAIQRSFTDVQRHFNSWSRLSPVWRLSRAQVLEQFRSHRPSPVDFDAKLRFYHGLTTSSSDTADESTIRQVDFLQIDSTPLVSAVRREAQLWVLALGALLAEETRPELSALSALMDDYEAGLAVGVEPESLEDLMAILAAVAGVHDVSMDVELRVASVMEAYDSLNSFGFVLPAPAAAELAEQKAAVVALRKSTAEAARRAMAAGAAPGTTGAAAARTGKGRPPAGASLAHVPGSVGAASAAVAVGAPVITVSFLEMDSALSLLTRWQSLRQLALERSAALETAKARFRAVTEEEAGRFAGTADTFAAEFDESGPSVLLERAAKAARDEAEETGNAIAEDAIPDEVMLTAEELATEFGKRLVVLLAEKDAIQRAQNLFGLDQTSFASLALIEQKLTGLTTVLELYSAVARQIDAWGKILFRKLEVSVLEQGCDKLVSKVRKLPAALQDTVAAKAVKAKVSEFQDSIPLLQDLRHDALRPRHWARLGELTGHTFDTSDGAQQTLSGLFTLRLSRFAAQIASITTGARKELSIEKGLHEITQVWRATNFSLSKYQKGTTDRGYVLRGVDDVLVTLEDNMMNLATMASSRFVAPFSTEVRAWEKRLSLVAEVCDAWIAVQRKWMYLESIFIGAEDIRLQLPEEAKRFDRIDAAFLSIMTETAKNTNVLDTCHATGRLARLVDLQAQMDTCQKSLSEYLETKRSAFTRFYFVSDDELLSVLGSSDPLAVQPHCMKMFDNTGALIFGTGAKARAVIGARSSEGEEIALRVPVPAEGPVESWMSAVDAEMRRTLHATTKEGIFVYARTPRLQWVHDVIGMVTLSGSQTWWTWGIEDVFRSVSKGDMHAMKRFASQQHAQIRDLVAAIRSPGVSRQHRKKLNTLIIIDVHARDIVDGFVRDSILDATEFAWESQMRFYWNKATDSLEMRQCTGVLGYGYEFEGLAGRLVITPLTDRCIMTLTTALTFYLGGSPAGPAGTGKTETVKDLAKHLAVPCLVTNCSAEMDTVALARNFAGLAENGAWGCFDEFNRIEASVLSVVAAQITSIQTALQQHITSFVFEGREIRLVPTMGVFITMNPGYAGRTELPDNLKTLFRPVVMVVPDLMMICEIMLFSEGFEEAKTLSKKMVVLYRLAQEQLSKQPFYDFGLRALRSVLVMAGQLKRGAPDMDEAAVLMRCLRDMNAPKFVFEDVPLFLGLISDLFPELHCPRARYPDFNDAVEEALSAQGYVLIPTQVDKVVQLYETMLARHCCMVVGPSGGAKTVIIDTLARAQTKLGLKTSLHVLNAKALPVLELYGSLDPDTREWTDGLLSNIFRTLNQPTTRREQRNIVFDSDIDAVWIENMNSVMDDNQLLTLPNGERIALLEHCKLLFEVGDLQYASPATISRAGMVYCDPKNLGHRPYFDRWVSFRADETQRDVLLGLFEKYVPGLLDLVIEGVGADGSNGQPLTQVIPRSALNHVTQLCTLLSAILDAGSGDASGDGTGQDEADASASLATLSETSDLEAVFIFALVYSLGAALDGPDREVFDKRLKSLALGVAPVTSDTVTFVPAGQLPALPGTTLFDYRYDAGERRWVPWSSEVAEFTPPADGSFHSILVPTVDTARGTWLLDTLVTAGKPLLLVGESGTAKTVTVQNYLNSLDASSWLALRINFSSRTSSADVQRSLEATLEKRLKGTFGPPPGKKLIAFVDDLLMPRVDTYGTQQPIALLKLLIERGGIYDRGKDLNFKKILDLQFLGAMPPPGAGRNNLDPRFSALFSVFHVTFPSDSSLRRIYSSILTSHLASFPDEMQSLPAAVTEMTLQLYRAVVKSLPPTPAKFHYVFSLRELSDVYHGLTMATTDKVATVPSFVRLWRNECTRVFSDRLTSATDREVVSGTIARLVQDNFGADKERILMSPLCFGDFIDAPARIAAAADHAADDDDDGTAGAVGDGAELPPPLYEDLGDFSTIKPVADAVLKQQLEKSRAAPLVMFDYALEHLLRVYRVLRMARGHALLIGVGGSGKQSLTRLAAFMAGIEVFEITLSRGYGEADFREDLRTLYRKLGQEGREMAFLFTDQHVVEESFLELLNNMLTSGMVPALFEEDEREALISSVRQEAVSRGVADTRDALWSFFVNKCRDNLHIVLCFSPVGPNLRQRCRSFPGLVNCCTLDWFDQWPADALRSVATVSLASTDLSDVTKAAVTEHMVQAHLSVVSASEDYAVALRRHNYVTPRNYLDYIANFRRLLSEHRDRVDSQIQRLSGGLDKLVQAASEVDDMSRKLVVQKKEVDEKTAAVAQLLEKIEVSTTVANEKKALATQNEAQLAERSVAITQEKEEAEQILELAIPALEAAEEALKSLSRDDITEIRAFAKPPAAVQSVCECVAILRGQKEVSWKSAKAMMASTNFLSELVNFDKDSLTAKTTGRVVNDYVKKLPNFTHESMLSVSTAGAGLLNWVLAMVNYYDVAKQVAPKRKRVKAAEKELAMATAALDATKAELAALEEELASLGDQLSSAQAEAARLKQVADVMERRLDAAQRLITGLSAERERWGNDIASLRESRVKLDGDAVLLAGFLSYTGAFTHEYRKRLVQDEWHRDLLEREVPVTTDFSVQTLLASAVEVSQWSSEGLPADELSVQNGILTTRAGRWPLCIDPQLQAVTWIKRREASNGLKVTSFNDPDFLKHLELAVNYGTPLLFEGIDENIDPVINPVLEKTVEVQGSRRFVRIGDKEVDYDDNFRLYLTTKLANPHYDPEIFGKTSIINYSVTRQGLEDQLLNVVVGRERGDLEEKREGLIQEMSQSTAMLEQLENTLLRELASSSGLILDNDELIRTLENTKAKALEISQALDVMTQTANEIDVARNAYRNAAKRGSVLFFAMSGLSSVSEMYEYSLGSFLGVFRRALDVAATDSNVAQRVQNVIATLTEHVYDYVCTSIFEAHKLMFSFHMTTKVLQGDGLLDESALAFFLKGSTALSAPSRAVPFPWIPAQGWADLVCLEETGFDSFLHVCDDVAHNEQQWRTWFDAERPESEMYPMQYEQLEPLAKLCLLRCFRVDRVHIAIALYVTNFLGDRFIQPPVLSYERVFQQSDAATPVVFILSAGSDPASDIFALGQKHGFAGPKLRYVSLGQGQGPVAEQHVRTGIQRGHWVLLMNLHLLPKWLKTLEKTLENAGEAHPDFRLWLTTEPTDKFPLGLLQRSIKVVTEPPNGLKLNVRANFAQLTDDQLSASSHAAFRPLVFVLAFFHAVVQERRKYGSIGYNVPTYDFNASDFKVSLELMRAYLDKAIEHNDPNIPWGSLRYLIGDAMYGGRVTDSFDRKVVVTYLEEYMGDFLFDAYQPFHFHHCEGGFDYRVPAGTTREAFSSYIETLPLVNSPAVFGLHANAEIKYLDSATRSIWEDLLGMQPRTATSGSSGPTREEHIAAVATDLQARLPEQFDLAIIRKNFDIPSPTQVVLLQELERFNALIALMEATLRDLQRALIGEIGMSSELDAIADCLFNGQLPEPWRRKAPATEKALGGWVTHFLRRHAQYVDWVAHGEPRVMWLSGIAIPESYLTALVQTACRAKGWPLDRSTLFTRVTDFATLADVPGDKKPEFGCYIEGLFLEGAGWDAQRRCLRPQNPKELVVPLPVVQVIPAEASRLRLRGTFSAPLYVTQARRNAMGVGLVTECNLETDMHESHWILQGVALVLNVR